MAKPEEILKSARESKGYTQATLAAAIGISSRMLQRYEEGRFPKYKSDSIRKVDELLGTKLYEIIYDTLVPHETNPEEEIFLNGPIKITAQEYVDALKKDKEDLQEIVKVNLTALTQMLSSLVRHDQAYHETILRALARIEKLEQTEALVLEAGTLEAERFLEEQKKHNEKAGNFRK